MATRRDSPEDWKLQQATETQMKPQPRTERVMLPNSVRRYRETSGPYSWSNEASTVPPAPPPSRKQSAEYQDSPPEPQIVDFSDGQNWHRRPQPLPSRKCLTSTSVYSQPSARQSEVSFGILDYYMRPSIDNPVSLPQPAAVDRPLVDSAIEQLDFGLGPLLYLHNPTHNLPSSTGDDGKLPMQQITPEHQQRLAGDSGPVVLDSRVNSTPLATPSRHKGTYALFPNVETTTPTRNILKLSQIPAVPPPAISSPTTPVTPMSSAQYKDLPISQSSTGATARQPARPRNASLSNSVRSRKDSFTSFHYPNKRIPLRLLSSSTSNSSSSGSKPSPIVLPEEPTSKSPESASFSRKGDIALPNASMPPTLANFGYPSQQTPVNNKYAHASRWSDETCPSAMSTPISQRAPRTSFSSLLGDSEGAKGQYPACFFESDDEDEATPLRHRLKWRRSAKARPRRNWQGPSSDSRTRTIWSRLCCGCCSSEVDGS